MFFIYIVFFIAPVLCGFSETLLSNKYDEPASVEDHPNLGLLPNGCGFKSSKLIGGNQTLLYELPWMVLLSYNTAKGNRLSCVGTLINDRYVLTAAQCVTPITQRSLNGVILGEHDLTTDPDCEFVGGDKTCGEKVRNVTVEEVVSHPGYSGDERTFSDDIALLRLSQPVDFKLESVDPVCLPVTKKLQREALVGQQGDIAGWGIGIDKIGLPVLSQFSVSILSTDECQSMYNRTSKAPQLSNKHLCIRSKYFGGDAGGPLVVFEERGMDYRYFQRGVVSFGPRARGTDIPDVYTNVAYYMKWILDTIRK